MRAVIYTRASLDRTGEGKSNDRQREECIRLCEYKRWEMVKVDGEVSADDISISAYGTKERPAWLRVLSMIESGEVDVVVAWHLDRLTRNMADLEKLILLCEERNVLVATATGDMDLTNDTGRMVARILAAVARQEVERKAARQKLAHLQRREAGLPWTAVKMLGYSPAGKIVEKEAKAIREAIEDVIDEKASLAEVGRRWQKIGLTSPYKDDTKPWSIRGVKKVLTNPRIAGFVTHKGEVVGEGRWDPIVSENKLTIVTAKLTAPERSHGKSKSGRTAANLLTGIMTCAKCGEVVRAGSSRGKPTYMCGNWHTYVSRKDADELVRSSFAAAVALTHYGSILSASQGEADAESTLTEIELLKDRLRVLASSYGRGVTSEEAYEAATSEVSDQIAALEQKLQGTDIKFGTKELHAEQVREFLSLDWTEQRRILQRLAVIKVHQANRRPSDAGWQVEVLVRGKVGEEEVLTPAHVPGVLNMQNAPKQSA